MKAISYRENTELIIIVIIITVAANRVALVRNKINIPQ